ncbi:MAG: hypothetical protein KC475_09080 [Cyanobacteria bacterium HKST-UBA03]|nr:hypothetical protein [Cyanobacteria bacterium HKST-UBA03]
MHIHGGSLPPDNRNRMNPHKPGNTGTAGQSSRPEDTNPNSHEPRNPEKGIEPKPETPFTFGKSDSSPIFSSPDLIISTRDQWLRATGNGPFKDRDSMTPTEWHHYVKTGELPGTSTFLNNLLKNGGTLFELPPQPVPNPPDDGPVAD